MGMQTDEVLGLSLMDSTMDVKPSILIYGPPGGGKTTSVAQAFQDLLWVVSEPDSLRYYQTWAESLSPAERAEFRMPRFKYIPEFQPDGKTRFNNKDAIRQIVDRYCDAVVKGNSPYSGIVFDQHNTFAQRVYAELQADPSYGKNKFARIDALKSWNNWICSIPRFTNTIAVLICHEAAPKFDEDEDSPTFRKLLYKGGPAFPIGTERESMAAMATICLRTALEGGEGNIRRMYMTEASPMWHAKFRDVRIKAKEKMDLRELVIRAGYRI